MSYRVCPYCFETFKRSEVMFRCTNEKGCNKEDDSVMHKFWGSTQMELPAIKPKFSLGSLIDKMPESAECQACGNKSYTMICPHCHNIIPKDMVEHKGYIISIIGARSSGKTIYIATLINQLKKYGKYLDKEFGIIEKNVANRPEYNTEKRYETDFYNVVFKDNRLPKQTQISDIQNRYPLIYKLTQKNKPPLYLVFYDTAGENFVDPKNIASNVKFLDHSDAILFLMDTFSIPYVHDKLKLSMELPEIELKFDKILANLITHIDESENKIRDAFYNKPMALVFSKIDAIIKNEELFRDTSISGLNIERNSSFLDGSGINLADIDEVSNSIFTALDENWEQHNFTQNISNHFKNAKYFGISALGDMPDLSTQSIKNLRPYRVLDPLVWILLQFKYSLRIAK